MSRQIINKTERGVTAPSIETLVLLALALRRSPLVLIRQAGLLPISPGSQEDIEDITFLLEKLPPDRLELVRRFTADQLEPESHTSEIILSSVPRDS